MSPGLCQSKFAVVCPGIQSLGELLPVPAGADGWVGQLPVSSASASPSGWARPHGCNSRFGEPFPLGPAATSQALALLSGLLPPTPDCLMRLTKESSFFSPSDTLPEPSKAQAALDITQVSWVRNSCFLTFRDCSPGLLQQSFLPIFFLTAISVFLISPAKMSNQGLSRCQHLVLNCKSG